MEVEVVAADRLAGLDQVDGRKKAGWAQARTKAIASPPAIAPDVPGALAAGGQPIVSKVFVYRHSEDEGMPLVLRCPEAGDEPAPVRKLAHG